MAFTALGRFLDQVALVLKELLYAYARYQENKRRRISQTARDRIEADPIGTWMSDFGPDRLRQSPVPDATTPGEADPGEPEDV